MISSDNALEAILKNTRLLKKEVVNLYYATGYTIAEDIYSNIDFPPFDQAAMDGYALKFEDYKIENSFKINGEVQAGVVFNETVRKNEAIRIFTGAPVPSGVDTVVMQEKTTFSNGILKINDENLKKGSNIRPQGSQTRQNQLVLKSGSNIRPGVAGFIAGLGINKVKIYKKPNVCIISTGKELTKTGKKLKNGKIFESNSYSLYAALCELNISEINIFTVDDKPKEIEKCINENLKNCDLMILTGGVSVGDYDFVVESLKNCRVKKIFHKVKQKPGKPLYFGKIRNTLVFGLPGNPSAVLTCFYIYILPAILKMTGKKNITNYDNMILQNDFNKRSELTYFLKGKIDNKGVLALHSQESYQMNSYAEADCIIKLKEEKTYYKKGEIVEIIKIQV